MVAGAAFAMRLRPLGAALALGLIGLAFPAPGDAQRLPCAPGRFLVPGGERLVPGGAEPLIDAVVIDPGDRPHRAHVAIDSGCGAASARLRRTRGGTALRVSWRSCGAWSRVRLRALIQRGSACRRLVGTLRARGVPPQSVLALRSSCGDDVVDTAGGETCESDSECPPDEGCDARCTCSPVGALRHLRDRESMRPGPATGNTRLP